MMSAFPESVSSKKPFSIGRVLPVVAAVIAVGGLTFWFVKPKPDVRYARVATTILDQAQPGSKVVTKLDRGAKVNVMLAKELDGWAMVTIQPSSGGFLPLSEIDTDRRPVLTGAYKAKALQKAISLREEPNPVTAQVDQIPAKTMVQVWGYTATPSGNWAEITRYKEKGVGYVLREELEAAFE
ncbi:hypothetical protein [Aquidulcibacter sp.]|jgi:hypothetical protein|uniref:hypothetical protein n=1 Tax=Aquidulcibacter sp. TaxID=2052990 RepID=UPI0037C0A6F5